MLVKFARRNAERLLPDRIRSEGPGRLRRNEHLPDHHRLAAARDPKAKPAAEGGEEHSDQRSIELDRMLDDDEAVLGVLKRGDQQPANKTEDKDVPLHS